MQIQIKKGQSLWEALAEQNIVVERPCGGHGLCGACQVEVEGRGLVRACIFREEGCYEVQLPEGYGGQESAGLTAIGLSQGGARSGGSEAIRAKENRQEGPAAYACVDLGTTTVAGFVRQEGSLDKREFGFVNPQRIFGADVASRIELAASGKEAEMTRLIRQAILREIEAQMDEPTAQSEAEFPIWVSGNTTMLHLLEGLPVESLGSYPFTPGDISCHSFRTRGQKRTYVWHILPGISAYVGADIASGIRLLGMDREEEISLLVDLGTNGELALGNRDRILVASTAAGPAFEASDLGREIHASGLMQRMHEMLDQRIIDSYGTLAEPYFKTGYCGMSQELLRELQMAKAAIAAGIQILLEEYGIGEDAVKTVYLAGGMGFYAKAEDAIAIGLLPAAWADRIRVVGNTSLEGCAQACLEQAGDSKPSTKARETREVVLANHPGFEERYIEAMNFPGRIRDYVVIDLEMTGLSARENKIIEVGAARVRGGRVVDTIGYLVDPREPIPPKITELTGITDAMVAGAAEMDAAVEELLDYLGEDVIVGQNVSFDYSFLKQWAVNHKRPLEARCLDTLKLARGILPQDMPKRLENLCTYFQIPRENAHRALDDALETAQVYEKLCDLYEEEGIALPDPKPLVYHAKKQSPATKAQVERLHRYIEEKELPPEAIAEIHWETLTRSQASRIQDVFYAKYGR